MTQTITFDVQLVNRDEPVGADVIQALAALFKKTEQQVETLLARAPVVVKKQVSQEQANRYKLALENAGASVELIPNKIAAHELWSLEPTTQELELQSSKQQQETDHTGKAEFSVRDLNSHADQREVYRNHSAPDVVSEPDDDSFYEAPQAEIDEEHSTFYVQTFKQLYFGFKGRINRSTFWLKYFLPGIGVGIAFGILTAILALVLPLSFIIALHVAFNIAAIWVYAAIVTKRLHDMNLSGWWFGGTLLSYIAFAGISFIYDSVAAIGLLGLSSVMIVILFILVGFVPGNARQNKYGYPQH
ncbi:MAG: ribosomal protein L7/L12 [Gammaproteobacteria bacterium]|nr:ribosomal protein L7/L12 [Gammaproteobacteria bacterium]